jgi:flagellar basal-body rod modification protein FlgD
MTTVNPAQSAFAANAAPAPASTVLNSDFETFLKMLTVQMQNQDPLNPMDSSEYAMQLATFSGLEQQVLTNELLNSLIYLGSQTGVSGLADWIGLEGRSGGQAYFDGNTSVGMHAAPLNYATAAQLVVYDENGTEVDRMDIPVDAQNLNWDGARQPAGLYSFQVESYANGELAEVSAAETWARIQEARNDNGAVLLVMEGGAEVYSDQITGVRDPVA